MLKGDYMNEKLFEKGGLLLFVSGIIFFSLDNTLLELTKSGIITSSVVLSDILFDICLILFGALMYLVFGNKIKE